MNKEKEYKLPESLIIAILNYISSHPSVSLVNQIQTVVNKQVKTPNKEQKDV